MSILLRPRRTVAKANVESSDKEYEKEQARLAAKRHAYQSTEAYLRNSRTHSAEGHAQHNSVGKALQASAAEQLAIHEEQEEARKHRDASAVAMLKAVDQAQDAEESRRRAHRIALGRDNRDANKQLIADKEAREKEARELQIVVDNSNLAYQALRPVTFR
jgi:hypothetical protein